MQGLYGDSTELAKQEFQSNLAATKKVNADAKIQTLSGVGQQAFASVTANSDDIEISLWAQDGDMTVRVGLQVFPDDSKATADQLVDSAKQIAASIIKAS